MVQITYIYTKPTKHVNLFLISLYLWSNQFQLFYANAQTLKDGNHDETKKTDDHYQKKQETYIVDLLQEHGLYQKPQDNVENDEIREVNFSQFHDFRNTFNSGGPSFRLSHLNLINSVTIPSSIDQISFTDSIDSFTDSPDLSQLTPEEEFDRETYEGLELVDDSTLQSIPDDIDIEYGDEFRSTFARRLGAVRSMLTELSCRKEKCVHSKKYLKALMDYGCNCYPRNKGTMVEYDDTRLWWYASRGKPVDAVDKACKNAFINYKCFTKDAENESITDNMTCRQGIPFKFHLHNGEIICGPVKNPDYIRNPKANQCKLAACLIEREFSYTVFDLIGTDPIQWRLDNKNNYFKLMDKGSCQKASSTPINKDQCCGGFPNRIPYNSLQHDCCEERFLSGIGTC